VPESFLKEPEHFPPLEPLEQRSLDPITLPEVPPSQPARTSVTTVNNRIGHVCFFIVPPVGKSQMGKCANRQIADRKSADALGFDKSQMLLLLSGLA
jgi:hypothetical protein